MFDQAIRRADHRFVSILGVVPDRAGELQERGLVLVRERLLEPCHERVDLVVVRHEADGLPDISGELPRPLVNRHGRILYREGHALWRLAVHRPLLICRNVYSWAMNRDEILRVLRAFSDAGLEYTIIGATAMGVHGLVRATEDIDLFIKATPENVERLRAALTAAYDQDPSVQEISTADLLGEDRQYAIVRRERFRPVSSPLCALLAALTPHLPARRIQVPIDRGR